MKLGKYLKAKSPELFIAFGIAAIIGGTIQACKASRKVDEIIDEHNAVLEEIHEDTTLIDREMKREVVKEHVDFGVKLVKLYAGPVAVIGLGTACILKGHGILRERYAGLLATYKVLDKGYKIYRERVISELGEDMDRHFRFGETVEKVDVTELDESGKQKKKKVEMRLVDPELESYSPYARIFDEFSSNWTDDPGVNKARILHVESYLNDKLKIVKGGKIFLNEAYEALGFPPTKAGQRAGWDRNSKNGDHFVSFGIQDIVKRAEAGDVAARMWVNGYETNCLLDFNCYDITDDMDEI